MAGIFVNLYSCRKDESDENATLKVRRKYENPLYYVDLDEILPDNLSFKQKVKVVLEKKELDRIAQKCVEKYSYYYPYENIEFGGRPNIKSNYGIYCR